MYIFVEFSTIAKRKYISLVGKRGRIEKLFKSNKQCIETQQKYGDKTRLRPIFCTYSYIYKQLTELEDGHEACDDKEERVSRVRAPTSKAKDLRARTSDQSRRLDIGKYPLWPPECWGSSPRCTRVASTPSAVYKLTRITCVSVPVRFHPSTRLIKSDDRP